MNIDFINCYLLNTKYFLVSNRDYGMVILEKEKDNKLVKERLELYKQNFPEAVVYLHDGSIASINRVNQELRKALYETCERHTIAIPRTQFLMYGGSPESGSNYTIAHKMLYKSESDVLELHCPNRREYIVCPSYIDTFITYQSAAEVDFSLKSVHDSVLMVLQDGINYYGCSPIKWSTHRICDNFIGSENALMEKFYQTVLIYSYLDTSLLYKQLVIWAYLKSPRLDLTYYGLGIYDVYYSKKDAAVKATPIYEDKSFDAITIDSIERLNREKMLIVASCLIAAYSAWSPVNPHRNEDAVMEWLNKLAGAGICGKDNMGKITFQYDNYLLEIFRIGLEQPAFLVKLDTQDNVRCALYATDSRYRMSKELLSVTEQIATCYSLVEKMTEEVTVDSNINPTSLLTKTIEEWFSRNKGNTSRRLSDVLSSCDNIDPRLITKALRADMDWHSLLVKN